MKSLLAVACLVLAACAAPEITAAQQEQAAAFLKDIQARGALDRYSCVGNEAYIRPVFWEAWDAATKRTVTRNFGAVCEAEKSGTRMTIYDSQSGKRLAYTDGDSFTVY